MNVAELFERIREYNIDALRAAVAQHPDSFVEPALCDDSGEVAVEGPFELPVRVDLVLAEDGVPTEQLTVDPAKAASFDAFGAHFCGLDVRVSPFGWDYVHVRAETLKPAQDFAPLCDWYLQWFDAEDTREQNADGLYEVVHFMSDPEVSSLDFSFVVDLGSAPVEALLSLVEVLQAMGAVRAQIGTENAAA